jgi:hypothetical protein
MKSPTRRVGIMAMFTLLYQMMAGPLIAAIRA